MSWSGGDVMCRTPKANASIVCIDKHAVTQEIRFITLDENQSDNTRVTRSCVGETFHVDELSADAYYDAQ